MTRIVVSGIAACLLAAGAAVPVAQQTSSMTFFITSTGPGNGANLGGLAGADKHCQSLAAAAGAGNRTWRAYLSATAAAGQPAVNARDRIGAGPWHNAKGVQVAAQCGRSAQRQQQALERELADRKGRDRSTAAATSRTSTTSSRDRSSTARASTGTADTTCGNWTSSGDGSAHGRPSRPAGRRHESDVMELRASDRRVAVSTACVEAAAKATSTVSPRSSAA